MITAAVVVAEVVSNNEEVVIGTAVVVFGQLYSSFPLSQSTFPSQAHRKGMHEDALHVNSPGQVLSA